MAYSVANSVYRRRTLADLTQEELAEKAGVSRQTIIAIERGNYTPSVLLALRIAKAFRVGVEDVFELIHEK